MRYETKTTEKSKETLAEAMAQWAYLNGLSYVEPIVSEEEKKEKENRDDTRGNARKGGHPKTGTEEA